MSQCTCVCVTVCVCVCVCERERERESVCVCVVNRSTIKLGRLGSIAHVDSLTWEACSYIDFHVVN